MYRVNKLSSLNPSLGKLEFRKFIDEPTFLDRIEKREDQLLRKQNLEDLAAKNEKSRKAKLKKVTRPPSKLTRKPTQFTTLQGKIFHGKTFNIVYNPDLIKS